MTKHEGKIVIPAGRAPWEHEMRVAEILAEAGHVVEFLPERMVKTADILLDGVEFEIKSPRSGNANSLEHALKKALRQASSIIVDTSRIRDKTDEGVRKFLLQQVRMRKQIKRLLMVTKHGRVIDIVLLV